MKEIDNILDIVLATRKDRKIPVSIAELVDLEVCNGVKVNFEREVKKDGQPQNLAELMGFDYSESFPEFYEFLKTFVEKYEIFFHSKKQNPEMQIFEVVSEDGKKCFRQIPRYDCFNIIWLVFSNLIDQNLLPDDLDAQMIGRFKTTDVVQEAIAKNLLLEVKVFTEFRKKSGFVFYNFTEGGFETKWQRHCGFYCILDNGSVSFFQNANNKNFDGGAREKKFNTKNEFHDWLMKFHSAYTINQVELEFVNFASKIFRQMRKNIGHFD